MNPEAVLKISTGKLIRINKPFEEINKIELEDLVSGMNGIMRFNGQHPLKISVLFHSYLTAKLAAHFGESPLIQLFCLFHDAPEVFLNDISTPVKAHVSQFYRDLEEDWDTVIDRKFIGTVRTLTERVKVKKYDDMAYHFESGLWALSTFGAPSNLELDTVWNFKRLYLNLWDQVPRVP